MIGNQFLEVPFIDYMHSGDKISVVLFTSSAQLVASMTNDETTLRNSLKEVYSNGGTNFSVAINRAISSFAAKSMVNE